MRDVAVIADVVPGAVITVAAVLYMQWLSRRRVARWRAVCFAGALIATVIATYGPVDELAHARFSAHMVQHLLLMTVAAPLAIAGDAGRVLRRGAPRTVLTVLASIPVGIRRAVAKPMVAAAVATTVLWTWHLPAFYEAALKNDPLHGLEHLTFFLASVLVWAVAFGARRANEGTALLLLFATSLAAAALGAIITFADSILYPTHEAEALVHGFDPLTDQQLAGAIMWIPPGVVNLVAMVILVARLIGVERSAPATAGDP